MIIRLFVAAVLLLVTSTTPTWAHGTGSHVLGTVTTIDAVHLEVTNPKGEKASVELTEKTRFQGRGGAKGRAKPEVGDRVVVETTKSGESLIATEIQFSRPSPVKSAF
jgi:hypothetical protein